MEEKFFESKTYNNLISQAQELLKYINLLKSKNNQYEKLIKDFEKARTTELDELFKKIQDDKDKYLGMIKELSVSYDNEKRKFDQLESELIKEYDLSVKFNSFMQIVEQSDQKYSTLNQENELLRTQVKEYNENLQKANAELYDLRDKVNVLVSFYTFLVVLLYGKNQQNFKLKAMVPGEIKLEEISYRHSKHRLVIIVRGDWD